MIFIVLWEILILLSGTSTGIVGGTLMFFLGSLIFQGMSQTIKFKYYFITFLIAIILADNYGNSLVFYQDFRYIIVLYIFFKYYKYAISKFTIAILPFIFVAIFSSIIGGVSSLIDFLRIASYIPVIGVINIFFKVPVVFRKEKFLSYFYLTVIIINVLLLPMESQYYNGRFYGFMANPNGLAMVISALLIGFSILSKRPDYTFSNRVHSLIVFCGVLLIVFTGSRMSLVALFAFYFLVARGKVLFLSLLSFLILTIAAFIFDESIPLLRSDTINNFGGRMEVWRITYQEGINNWFFGGGLGYQDIFLSEFRKENFVGQAPKAYYAIFNSYLSIFINLGVLGLSTMIFFWIRCFMTVSASKISRGVLVYVLLLGITESYMRAALSPVFPFIILTWHLLKENTSKRIITA